MASAINFDNEFLSEEEDMLNEHFSSGSAITVKEIECANKENELADKENEINSLKEEVDHLKLMIIHDKTFKMKNMDPEPEETEKKGKKKTEAELKICKEKSKRIPMYENLINEQKIIIRKKEVDIKTKEQIIKNVQDQHLDLKNDKIKMQEKIEELNLTVKSLEKSKLDLKNKNAKMMEINNMKENNLDRFKTSNEHLKIEIQSKNRSNNILHKDINIKDREYVQLFVELKSLERFKETAVIQIDTLKKKIGQMETDWALEKSDYLKGKKYVQQTEVKYGRMTIIENEKNKLSVSLAKFKRKCREVRKFMREAEAENLILKNEIEKIKNEYAIEKEKKVRFILGPGTLVLKEEINNLKEKNNEYKRVIDNIYEDMEKNKLKDTPEEKSKMSSRQNINDVNRINVLQIKIKNLQDTIVENNNQNAVLDEKRKNVERLYHIMHQKYDELKYEVDNRPDLDDEVKEGEYNIKVPILSDFINKKRYLEVQTTKKKLESITEAYEEDKKKWTKLNCSLKNKNADLDMRLKRAEMYNMDDSLGKQYDALEEKYKMLKEDYQRQEQHLNKTLLKHQSLIDEMSAASMKDKDEIERKTANLHEKIIEVKELKMEYNKIKDEIVYNKKFYVEKLNEKEEELKMAIKKIKKIQIWDENYKNLQEENYLLKKEMAKVKENLSKLEKQIVSERKQWRDTKANKMKVALLTNQEWALKAEALKNTITLDDILREENEKLEAENEQRKIEASNEKKKKTKDFRTIIIQRNLAKGSKEYQEQNNRRLGYIANNVLNRLFKNKKLLEERDKSVKQITFK